MGETGNEEPKSPQDQLKKADKLIQTVQKNKGTVLAAPDGQAVLDIYGTVEVIDKMEQVSLLKAEKGDVVWWKTESGSSGCFLIDTPYKQDGAEWIYGNGDILISRDKTDPRGDQQGKGTIRGATAGSSSKFAAIIKGKPIEFSLTEANKSPKAYTSTPVVDMGIIKATALNQA